MTLQRAPVEQSCDGVMAAESGASTIPPHDVFYRQLVARTCAVIGDGCQQRLRSAPIVVAGCGAIGGSVVEPLVRLGAERLILTDPGTYEISDLGRGPAHLRDVGRNKAETLAERVREINPYAMVIVEPRGVTDATVRSLVRDAAVIVDGLGTDGAAATARGRIELHARALRVPVVRGVENGGRCGVVVQDYRRAATSSPATRGAALVRRAIAGVNRGPVRGRGTAPRPGYTPALVGTLALPAIVTLIVGEPVVRQIAVDPCALVRPSRARLRRWIGQVRILRR